MPSRSLLTMALALLLAACASPLALKPGTSIEEARSTLGRPTAEIRLPDGGTRLQFSGQPNNQSVVNADFDAQGRLRIVEEMMTDESFARVRAGNRRGALAGLLDEWSVEKDVLGGVSRQGELGEGDQIGGERAYRGNRFLDQAGVLQDRLDLHDPDGISHFVSHLLGVRHGCIHQGLEELLCPLNDELPLRDPDILYAFHLDLCAAGPDPLDYLKCRCDYHSLCLVKA